MKFENEFLSGLPSYDRAGLDGVCHGNEVLRRKILLEYTRTAANQVGLLLGQMEAGEDELSRHTAHTLKGSSRTVGALALGQICERIEAHGIQAWSEAGRQMISEEFERVRREVQNHLESLP